MSRLSDEQVSIYLRKLPKWKFEQDHLVKTFQFAKFADSIQFVNQIAELAEHANHHPNIDIRYNQVKVSLTTHDKQGVSGKDFSLAQQIENT